MHSQRVLRLGTLHTRTHRHTLSHRFSHTIKTRRSQTICRHSSSIFKHNYDITRTHTLTDANFPRAARHPHSHTQTDTRQRTTTTADAAPLARRCRPTDACAMLPIRRVCRPTLSYARVCVRPSAKNTLTHNAHTQLTHTEPARRVDRSQNNTRRRRLRRRRRRRLRHTAPTKYRRTNYADTGWAHV